MKKVFSVCVVMILLLTACSMPCHGADTLRITVRVGSQSFQAVLYDTLAGRQFYNSLPQTFPMSELNRNEKYYYMSTSLPTASEAVGSIQSGDLMLYGSTCVVLFYESFSTPYSYTRLGKVLNPTGLKAALGSGAVSVTFAVAGKNGDVDKSGEINLKDVAQLKRYLAGGFGVQIDENAADVNQDGSVNLLDAAWITRWLAGGFGIML